MIFIQTLCVSNFLSELVSELELVKCNCLAIRLELIKRLHRNCLWRSSTHRFINGSTISVMASQQSILAELEDRAPINLCSSNKKRSSNNSSRYEDRIKWYQSQVFLVWISLSTLVSSFRDLVLVLEIIFLNS